MIAIPKRLLPDTLEVYAPDPDAAYEGQYLEARTIEGVRFEKAQALNQATYKLADGANGRIFIDKVNSKGAFDIPLGSKLVIGNTSMKVVSVTELQTFGGELHHWEVDVAWA